MKRSGPVARRRTGRPLSFDPELALYPAMLLFWRHGYEATSLADLTRAMGVTAPSIYAAYGDKKGLFRAAVRRYLAQPMTPIEVIEQAPTSEAAARRLVDGAATAFTGAETPAGCLLASSAIAVSAEADDLRRELAAIRSDIQHALCVKITSDIASGALRQDSDADLLAAYVMTIVQGFATLARDGATRATLQQVGTFALAVWPSMSSRS